jgi:ribokinase
MDRGRRACIVVVGSYAVGLVMHADRVPQRGETVLGWDFQAMDGGKGSNQAIACARLGAAVTFVAALGDDAYGERGLALLNAEGVETAYVRRVRDTPTGVGFIIVDNQGDNAIAVDLGANRRLAREDIDRAEEVIAGADVLLAQLEIPPETALYAAEIAHRHGVRTILNPAPAQPLPAERLAHVDILTPNLSEARTLTGLHGGEVPELAGALRRAGAGTVILTVGEQGAWVLTDETPRLTPAYRMEVIDTTGAGDAFSAALAVGLAEGMALEEAVRFACAGGAYAVQSLGTVPSYATRPQLDAFVTGHMP